MPRARIWLLSMDREGSFAPESKQRFGIIASPNEMGRSLYGASPGSFMSGGGIGMVSECGISKRGGASGKGEQGWLYVNEFGRDWHLIHEQPAWRSLVNKRGRAQRGRSRHRRCGRGRVSGYLFL